MSKSQKGSKRPSQTGREEEKRSKSVIKNRKKEGSSAKKTNQRCERRRGVRRVRVETEMRGRSRLNKGSVNGNLQHGE